MQLVQLNYKRKVIKSHEKTNHVLVSKDKRPLKANYYEMLTKSGILFPSL